MSFVCVCLCLSLPVWIHCLPAVQMASMLLPSSTCCSLVTLPLLWLSLASATSPKPATLSLWLQHKPTFPPSLVGQSWHILLKCLVHTGDRLVCLNCGNEMLLCGPHAAPQPRWYSYTMHTYMVKPPGGLFFPLVSPWCMQQFDILGNVLMPSARWTDWYDCQVFTVDMKLQPAAS